LSHNKIVSCQKSNCFIPRFFVAQKTMPAPLQAGCQVKAKVGPLVEHTKPDGAKAKRRQKSFMRGRIVASVFSVHFDINGRTEDMRSNTLVFVSDPQFDAPPASIPPEGQVPAVLLPSNPPPAAASTLAVPPPPALEETIHNNENEVAQTLACMPALLDPGDDDENDNSEHGSNEEEGNDNPPPDDHHHFLLAAGDDNEEDEHQDDIVENGDGNDVLILENNDEHVIKRQLCEEKKS
jgi:hypothetical protein